MRPRFFPPSIPTYRPSAVWFWAVVVIVSLIAACAVFA